MKNKLKVLLILLPIFIIIILFIPKKNDGMSQSGIYNIKYRTYSSQKGWTKWSKNGIKCGNKNSMIEKLEIKYRKTNKKSEIVMYSNDSKNKFSGSDKGKINIGSGLKMTLIGDLYRKYNICYRTFNSKNNWMDWSCDGDINGNKSEQIRQIEVKIIPKNVLPKEYLKNYGESENNIGF